MRTTSFAEEGCMVHDTASNDTNNKWGGYGSLIMVIRMKNSFLYSLSTVDSLPVPCSSVYI
jgi:hypothetical protein